MKSLTVAMTLWLFTVVFNLESDVERGRLDSFKLLGATPLDTVSTDTAPQPLPLKTYAEHPEIIDFITFMERKHQFSARELTALFAKLPIKVAEKTKLVGYTNRAPELKQDWKRYRERFLTRARIEAGAQFWNKHNSTLSRIRKNYGIPEEIIVATLGMESFYGKHNGDFSVLKSLTIFVAEKGRRQQFYFRELEYFLIFCKQNHYNPFAVKGSYSGAMGPAQFIPTSAFHYAHDGDGDSNINLFTNFNDILTSIGHYYAKCHWKKGRPIVERLNRAPSQNRHRTKKKYLLVNLPEKNEHWRLYPNYQGLKCYNNSHLYALTLFQLGEVIKHLYQKVQTESANQPPQQQSPE